MKKFIFFAAFFPFFNFDQNIEVIPLFAVFLPFIFQIDGKKLVLFAIPILMLTFHYILDGNLEIYATGLVVFLVALAASCRVGNMDGVFKLVIMVWFVSILFSNLNSLVPWDSLEGVLFRRVYVCDFPLTCARGGSGFSPEPAYAATVLFFLGLHAIYMYHVSERGWGISCFLIIASLLLTNTFVGYLSIFILLIYYAVLTLTLRSIVLSSIIGLLFFAIVSSNPRLEDKQEISMQLNTFEEIFMPFISQGSTREIGVYCGYKNMDLINLNTLYKTMQFQSCQDDLWKMFSKFEREGEGFKPYGPFPFIALYYGFFFTLLLVIFYMLPIFGLKLNYSTVVFLFFNFAFLFLRVQTTLPIPALVLSLVVGHLRPTSGSISKNFNQYGRGV